MNTTSDFPHSPIAPCPNPECRAVCIAEEENGFHYVRCSARQNCYHGPCVDELHFKGLLFPREREIKAKARAEAIRLHNLICRSSSVLEELEALEAEWRSDMAALTNFTGEVGKFRKAVLECADRLHALIGRYREPK